MKKRIVPYLEDRSSEKTLHTIQRSISDLVGATWHATREALGLKGSDAAVLSSPSL
uniref:Uncharacterized protein n=1 Tax=Arundo donax TaxID=35708 RepID=A0A0A9GIT6_ARUDO